MSARHGVVLRAEGLGFRYRAGDEELFDGLSHDFAPGEVTALTGPSGRGKSTLAAAFARAGGAARGEALVEGFRGLRLESPRGLIAIDAATRDIVQTVYIRRTEKRASDGRWVNVEI